MSGGGSVTWQLDEVLSATGGELVRGGAGPFSRVSIDSRTLEERDLFVALVGNTFDGHEFAEAACERGARGLVVSRGVPGPTGTACIRVGDTLEAYGELAAFRRKHLSARVVAITGSNGKTTTREMIVAILEAAGERVGRSTGNENNLVGVPKTILAFAGDETADVLEMGMNQRGEIERLVAIADPDVGVLTNVGPAHLEGLGTIENVAAAKGELAAGLRAYVPLVIDGDDPWLERIASGRSGPTLRIGHESGDVRIEGTEPGRGEAQRARLVIRGETHAIRLPCVGIHNVRNAALAAATAVALEVPTEAIVRGLEGFRPPPMRLEIVRTSSGALLWNDSYNANPASMTAALSALGAERGLRRMAALGEMLELGAEGDRFHREVGRQAAKAGVARLVAVGRRARMIAEGARGAGLSGDAVFEAATPDQAIEHFEDLVEGDLVLVKGSRGAAMERLVQALTGDDI